MTSETNPSGLTDAQVTAAVEWWRKAIERPKFDNGDDSPVGGMTMVMAMLASQPKPADQVTAFCDTLADRLKNDPSVARQGLHVDYHPEGALRDAAQAVGMKTELTSFPWKTYMRFTGEGGVTVRAGYGAEAVELLPAPTK